MQVLINLLKMLKYKKSEASSIGLIVAVVIGLIIIVVIVMMLSGKLGPFSKATDDASSCASLCKSAGYDVGLQSSPGTPGIKDGKGVQCGCA